MHVRGRFFFEVGLATAFGLAFVGALVWHDWIELVFGVDPDLGSGALEWLIAGALALVTFACSGLAGLEWRRARAAG